MKIILSTIVDNINFGTYLQAYATCRMFKERGCDIEVLNYIRPYINGKTYANKYLKDTKKPFIARYIFYVGYLAFNSYMTWQVKRFLTNRVKLTKEFTTEDEIAKGLKPYDLYLTGSDQVWNSQHNYGVDNIFFWNSFVGKKASYAASIGIDHFPEEQHEAISKMLSQYSLISVRENQGVVALQEIGIERSTQVLDPTLLLNKDDWGAIASPKFKKQQPYLLVYSVESERNSIVFNIARKIAKERNLSIYMVCPTLKFNSQLKIDKVYSLASVEMFLALVKNADYIVASSFHGTAFAINFNKQFVTVAPERFNSRVNSLLSLFNLENHYTNNDTVIPQDIDYAKVNGILDRERVKSKIVLDNIVDL